jgi:hypothetical protein
MKIKAMKNLKFALIICGATIAIPTAANAKNYAGFDLCGPATATAIKGTVEGAGGTVTRVVDKTYPDELIVIAKNYPIEVAPRSVSVTLYKGKIAYISIGNAGDLVQGIETKYGTNFSTSRKEDKVGITNSHHFLDPSDEALELTISQFEIANKQGTFFSVNYACKDLYMQVEKSREAYTKSDVKK